MGGLKQEVVILNSAWAMIDDMVNWAIFVKSEQAEPTNLMFRTESDRRLFAILLTDFLSPIHPAKSGDPAHLGLKPSPTGKRPSDSTFLFHLRQVAQNPQLGSKATALSTAVEAFSNWLETEFIATQVNFSTIDIVADLRIKRVQYIKMCGNVAKHGLARLASVVGELFKLLHSAGHPVSRQDACLTIEDFFEWFHRDIFVYHSSQIAEFLNNIRWAIYDYLRPEFQKSYHLTGEERQGIPIYRFRIPDELSDPLTRAMYWKLMNKSRSPPFVPRFVVAEVHKRRH